MKSSRILPISILTLLTIYSFSFHVQMNTLVGPNISFESRLYEFDTIPYAGNGNGVFHFENSGTDTLYILSVRSSCGCLVPSWSREPIPPGGKGAIKFHYLTRRVGPINRSMTVISDAVNEPRLTLRIKGFVRPKKMEH